MRRVTPLLLALTLLACGRTQSPLPEVEPDDAEAPAPDLDAAPSWDAAWVVDAGTPPDAPWEDLGASLDASWVDAASPTDAAWPLDARVEDVAWFPDADWVDAAWPLDARVEDVAWFPDADGVDAAPEDAWLEDALAEDAAQSGDARPLSALLVGDIRAMGGDPVTIHGLPEPVEVNGDFELVIPPGAYALTLEAPHHEAWALPPFEVEASGIEALEPVVLYRGRRLTEAQASRTYFRYDEAWALWHVGDRLFYTTLPSAAEIADTGPGYEVLLGHAPGRDAIAIRRHGEEGLAGPISLIDLTTGDETPLFEEGQPWLRWLGEQALAMTHTRGGLSRLEVVRPGEPSRVIAEGVPWLMVTDLADGRAAFMHSEPLEIGVAALGPIDHLGIGTGTAAAGHFLMTTRDRAGLIWLDQQNALWRWRADTPGVELIAEGVSSMLRPRDTIYGLLYALETGVAGEVDLRLEVESVERALVDGVSPTSVRLVGATFGAHAPAEGWVMGRLDGDAWSTTIPGGAFEVASVGEALYVSSEARLWRVLPGAEPEDLGTPMEQLRAVAPHGVLAWDAFEPGWAFVHEGGVERLPGAPELGVIVGASALYVREGISAGWRRVGLPDFEVSEIFSEGASALTSIDAARVFTWSVGGEGDLSVAEPVTGQVTPWAEGVTSVSASGRLGYALYQCARGLYLVSL